MTMNNSRLISNRIPLILENHDHVSLKINADASGWFARDDGINALALLQRIAATGGVKRSLQALFSRCA
mgnify:FL=1